MPEQTDLNKLQKAGGVAALLEGAIYLSAFIFYGIFWKYPTSADAAEKLAYLTDNKWPLYCATLFVYVFFGLILAVLVLALHEKMKEAAPTLTRLATLFGFLWVGLVIASGMISNVGLLAITGASVEDPAQVLAAWTSTNYVVEGLGGGNEIVGGLWVLLLSVAALKAGAFPNALGYLGMWVGAAGIATIVPADIFTEIFGLSQIVWFVWMGTLLLRKT